MYKYFPLLLVGGIVGIVSAILILAYALVKNKKESIRRHIKFHKNSG